MEGVSNFDWVIGPLNLQILVYVQLPTSRFSTPQPVPVKRVGDPAGALYKYSLETVFWCNTPKSESKRLGRLCGAIEGPPQIDSRSRGLLKTLGALLATAAPNAPTSGWQMETTIGLRVR